MKLKTYAEIMLEKECPRALALFNEIERVMRHFPKNARYGRDDQDKEIVLSCHIVARAVGKVFKNKVKVVDGDYHSYFNHSWLETPEGHVIDVYPVGMLGGPILVHSSVVKESAGRHLYSRWTSPKRAYFKKAWFKDIVRKVAESLAKSRS